MPPALMILNVITHVLNFVNLKKWLACSHQYFIDVILRFLSNIFVVRFSIRCLFRDVNKIANLLLFYRKNDVMVL